VERIESIQEQVASKIFDDLIVVPGDMILLWTGFIIHGILPHIKNIHNIIITSEGERARRLNELKKLTVLRIGR
jgi:hypothetical protein